ncbi:MAG TPA: FAD binding domain-containing protein [Myxococcota bacterium]|nr:FAD binding domain-containing protein [Myxococcota bacterium]
MAEAHPAEVHCVDSLQSALEARAKFPYAVVLAGGTEVMVAINAGRLEPQLLLDISRAEELTRIERTRRFMRIGALATCTDIARALDVQRRAPILVEACRSLGSPQVRNRATLGGAIGTLSPTGDLLPVLLVLDAEIEVASTTRGPRTVPVGDMLGGLRTGRIRSDELITAVRIPHPRPGDETIYRKVGGQRIHGVAMVLFAGRLQLVEGVVEEARVVFGCLGPTARRCSRVEQALVGGPPDSKVASLLAEDITPMTDFRASAAYRSRVAENLLRSWLDSLRG